MIFLQKHHYVVFNCILFEASITLLRSKLLRTDAQMIGNLNDMLLTSMVRKGKNLESKLAAHSTEPLIL